MSKGDTKDNLKRSKAFSVAKRLKARRGEPVRSTELFDVETVIYIDQQKEGDRPSDLLYQRARQVLEALFRAAKEGTTYDSAEIHGLAVSIVDNILASQVFQPADLQDQVGQSIFLRAFYHESSSSDFVEHTLNVAILSARLGSLLDYSHQDLLRLTFTALFHKIGMVFIPSKILNKLESLTAEERHTIQTHSELGAAYVRKMGGDCEAIAEVIYQVHERENGLGYPQGLSGNEIHIDAKIIGISDVYVAMNKPRVYREAYLPFDAMQAIIQTMEEQFAPHLVRALLQALSIFPVGSLVRLSSGEIGRVAAANPERPMRPIVEIIFDSRDARLEPPITMDLTEYPHIHIKGAITKESIAHMLAVGGEN
jgi:HD-GYP domain-containing protein (c-di-GMP phosphodiesterase class II)